MNVRKKLVNNLQLSIQLIQQSKKRNIMTQQTNNKKEQVLMQGEGHSQLDIYPQNLVITDKKLRQAEIKLNNIVERVQNGKNKIQTNINQKSSYLYEYQYDNHNKIDKDQQKQSKGDQRTLSSSPSVLGELLKIWKQEDKIDNYVKQQVEKTICFYQNKVNEIIGKYLQMKNYYSQLPPKCYNNKRFHNQSEDEHKDQYNGNFLKQNNSINITMQKQHLCQYPQFKSVQTPDEYTQIITLQGNLQALSQQNQSLKSAMSVKEQQMQKLKQRITEIQKQLTSKQNSLQAINNKIFQLQNRDKQLNFKYQQSQISNKQLKQKLQSKQKQLVKFIHSQSSFAAQQLTALQAALIIEKQQKERVKVQFNKKIEELQQKIRTYNYTCQNYKKQISQLKIQSSNNSLDMQSKQKVDKASNSKQSYECPQEMKKSKNLLNIKIQHKTSIQKMNKTHFEKEQQNKQGSNKSEQGEKLKFTGYASNNNINQQKNEPFSNLKNNVCEKSEICEDILQGLQQNMKSDDQVKFIRVISINDPYLSTNNVKDIEQTKDDKDQTKLNMNILNQVILVPVQSVDQVSDALNKLTTKLQVLKSVIKDKQSSIENSNKSQRNKKQQKQQKLQDKSLQQINKCIYQLAKQLCVVSNALTQNFQNQIIKAQQQQTIKKIKSRVPNASNYERQDNKLEYIKQEKDQNQPIAESSQSKPKIVAQQKESQIKIPTQPILQNCQDYSKAFKLIKNQLKSIFQVFFNNTKISFQEQQNQNSSSKGSQQRININSNDQFSATFQDVKNQDQQSILSILKKLSQLHNQMINKSKQISIKNKQKMQRLFDIIRSMIINFKISYKSMNNIISIKQIGQNHNKSKYLHLRLYLNNLYKALQHQNNIKLGITSSENDMKSNLTKDKDSSPTINITSVPVFTLYQNYQQKLQKLSSQLSKVRMQLDYKNQQHQNLKQLTAKFLSAHQGAQEKKMLQQELKLQRQFQNGQSQHQHKKIHSSVNLRSHSQTQSHRSRKNSNLLNLPQTLPSTNTNNVEKSQQNNVQMTYQQLQKQLQNYKKKCQQYEQQISDQKSNMSGPTKKKVIFIRK